MRISLEGKSALVGGSSKGIGFGIAKQLAESGASVCLMARDEKKMKLNNVNDAIDKKIEDSENSEKNNKSLVEKNTA